MIILGGFTVQEKVGVNPFRLASETKKEGIFFNFVFLPIELDLVWSLGLAHVQLVINKTHLPLI